MSICENLKVVHQTVASAALRAGRDPGEIRLMAVSKTKPLALVQEAYEAGQRLFGENRVAEGAEKFSHLPDDAELHLIGHLQKNKIRQICPSFHCIQSLDSLELAKKLIRYCQEQDWHVNVLLQLKTAEEGGKTGFETEGILEEAAGLLREQNHVQAAGLMTIAPFTDDEKKIRRAFARCRKLQQRLTSLYPDQDYSILSMGMSSDYEWAVLEGSTLLRIGTAIFGSR